MEMPRWKTSPEKPKKQRDWVEEMEVAGNELVDRVKSLDGRGQRPPLDHPQRQQ